MYDSIRPGQVWLDTEGKRIQAHGGSVIAVEDTFYWYGENKEKTDGKNGIWHWGVRCYSSKDLYNWKDEGLIIPPCPDDPSSPLHPSAMMDRPHIVFNKKTSKFVAWLKIMGEPPKFAVLTADHILGPYTMVNPACNPCDLAVGDFDIDIEPTDEKAYLFSERPHITMYIADLNDTYTDAVGHYTEHFPKAGPPETREAPAHFCRKGLHYLITSGTSGYHPNPSEVAVSRLWHGPYTVQGNPHRNDASMTSFGSQISCVFCHPGKKDLYIAMADRWMPDLSEREGEDYFNGKGWKRMEEKFRKIFDPDTEFVFSPEDAKEMFINSSVSDYVWLPIVFEGDRAFIDWRDEWRIEEF